MVQRFGWVGWGIVLGALAGCAPDPVPASGDAAADVGEVAVDGAVDGATGSDVATSNDVATGSDAATSNDVATGSDASVGADAVTVADATTGSDASTGSDAGARDAAVVDAGVRDVATGSDASTAPDAGVRDAATGSDATVTPGDAGCAGSAPVVTVTAPTMNAEVETCTQSGAPVYYDFRATVTASAGLRTVQAQWRTPSGDLAPPAPPAQSVAPFVWRRQVGGMMTDVPPLGILPNALRGTWNFEVTATDACGRSTTARQPFTLIFTMVRRCTNP